MLTGVGAEKHGVTWNEYLEESFSNVPTLFELAKEAGYSTAMAAGKMKFIALAKPGTLDWQYLPPDEPVTDRTVVAAAERIVREHRPHVLFVHLPGVDTAGHAHGWGSAEQVAAVEEADRLVGLLVDVLSDLALQDSVLVLLTSDHGGAGKGHGEDDPRSRFIPWIVAGAGVRRDFDLTLKDERTIRTQDTFATACAFLGLDAGVDCQGKPVLEALAEAHGAAPKSSLHAQADAR
jgi:arylsulfatase A-like enzyme